MKFINKFNMPSVYCEAIKQRTFSKSKTDSIGVTALIDSPYIRKLWREHEGEVTTDVADSWFQFRGSMTHQILEGVRIPNTIKELYLQVPLDGITLSGVIDLWLPGALEDYKTKSVNSFFYHTRLDELANAQQLNIYYWLLRTTFGVENIIALKIHHLFFDWIAKKAQTDNTYPQSPHVMYPVKIWPFEDTEKYIKDRLYLHSLATPEVCSPEERWTKAPVFALMKKGAKRSTKNFADKAEAEKALTDGYFIQERPGAEVRCESYCNVNQWCDHWKEVCAVRKKGEGE